MIRMVGLRFCFCDTNTPDNYTDPLNLPTWQKWVILVIVGLYAATGMNFLQRLQAVTDLRKAT